MSEGVPYMITGRGGAITIYPGGIRKKPYIF